MKACKISVKDFLVNPIYIKIKDKDLDFETAQAIAKKKAKELNDDPMLLAWYNGKTGDYTPKFDCGTSNTPAWIKNAESRGADITIVINEEEYIFIYKKIDFTLKKSQI
ncbi:DUF5619 domain-containing protein [Candidatus Magnetomoraceae bacterium gMMP-15]